MEKIDLKLDLLGPLVLCTQQVHVVPEAVLGLVRLEKVKRDHTVVRTLNEV